MTNQTGYAGRLLEIDLNGLTSKTIPLNPDLTRSYIGGRALGIKLLWDEYGTRWADVDPLGPESVFLILTGPTNGFAPGKTVSAFKSPLNGGPISSTLSGDMNAMIRFAGYDGFVIRGKAERPVYLYIEDDRVGFREANSLWGMDTRETHRVLMADTDPMTQLLYIGPAGENLVRYAVMMTNWYKACGRGGSGAVMGSKNLKAIAVKGNRPAPEIADPQKMSALMEQLAEQVPERSASMHRYGTVPSIYANGAEASAEPVRNWQEEWHNQTAIKAENFAAEQWQRRYWADYACTLACCKVGRIAHGSHAGEVVELPDYEGGAYVGTNLENYNIQDIPYLCDLIDRWGFDVITGGSVLGWTAELYQRGILNKKDLGGLDLAWGNAEAFAELIAKIGKREGIGDTLAEGTVKAAEKIGNNTSQYAVQVKGIELGAHGVRSGQDYTKDPISYAIGTQGGDHTSIATKTGEMWYLEDTLVLCGFWSGGVDAEQKLALLNASTGYGITQDEIDQVLLPRWIALQRAELLLSGWTHEYDHLPPRFYEPLPTGPYKGSKVDPEKEEELIQEAFAARGWDENGVPTNETLKKLDLLDLDPVLKPYRKA